MAKLAELRKAAKDAGFSPAEIRGASTEELEALVAGGKTATKKSATKKTVAKKSAARKSTKATAAKKSTTKNSKSTSSKSQPAKSRGAQAKRATTATGEGGRNLLGKVNYKTRDGWNAREGSAPDRIIKSLAKNKGDRQAVFTELKKSVWDFVSKKLNNGTKRPLRGHRYGAEEMLQYRIARTAWDFAVKTGQHDPSANRVAYGTGGTGEGIYKKNGSTKTAKAAGSSKSTTKRGGSSKSTSTKTKAQKGAQKVTGRKRGRPKGSKNKSK
jgi:hypothetical protein